MKPALPDEPSSGQNLSFTVSTPESIFSIVPNKDHIQDFDTDGQPSSHKSDLYQFMLDQLTDFISLCDNNYKVIESNHSARVILGGGNPIAGTLCYEKYRGRTSVCEDCPLQETLESGVITPVEYYDPRYEEYFEERLYPVRSDSEQGRFILVGRNITRTRELSDKSIQSKKLAALGQISSGVAHDFNNVLTGILGRIQILQRLTKDPNLLKNFEVIETAAKDGAATVKRMQDFARIREGTDFESVNLTVLINEVVALTRPKWRDGPRTRGILIETKLTLEKEVYILGAAYDLRRAITNLIFNAVDAMPDGGVLTLTSEILDDQVIVKIHDTGLGMTEETAERIFDPFFSTKGVKGTGLGLSEVYGVCKRHNGNITVTSTVGVGTTFTLSFPVAEKGIVRIPEPEIANEVLPSQIVVIDDEKYVLDIVDEVLSEMDHTVLIYSSAMEAINYVKKGSCDLVITDLGMPEMSGWEVARAIKVIRPDLPVILLTGWAMEIDENQIKENGVDYILQKPFSMEDLEQIVATAAQRKSL